MHLNPRQRYAVMIPLGIVLCFLALSLVTRNWRFFLSSLVPGVVSGVLGFITARRQNKT